MINFKTVKANKELYDKFYEQRKKAYILYVIGNVDEKLCLIGSTTKQIPNVLSKLQHDCPFFLTVLKTWVGAKPKYVDYLHDYYKKYKTENNFFRLEGKLLNDLNI